MDENARRDANAEAVWRYARAWSSGDLATAVDAYADDITLHYVGGNPFAGEHQGKPAAMQVLARIQALTNRQVVAVHDVAASADRAVLFVRERFEQDGRTGEVERVLVYRMRDAQFVDCWVYSEDQSLVDEFLAAG